MSSFWKTSAGTQATGVVEESNFDPLAKGWYTSMIEEMSIDEYEGERKIKVKARVVGEGAGKNRVLYLNLKAFEGSKVTEKQRDRAINMITKMANIFKINMPDNEPDDIWLSKFIDKPIDLLLDVWEIPSETGGDPKTGNWLVNVEAKGTKAGTATAQSDKPAARQAAKQVAKQATNFNDMDDDIPF